MNCSKIQHRHCVCCHKIGLNVEVNAKGVCKDCTSYRNPNYFIDKKALPIWYDDGGIPQFKVPEELSNLTIAECMLIQLNSPFIPLQHIKNGVFGLSGHVCSFQQDIEEFVNRLPRSKNDVTMLNVLKSVKAEMSDSDEGVVKQSFRVRKKTIGSALRWLKRYNIEYASIEIDMSALDWLDGDEGDMETLDLVSKDMIVEQDLSREKNVDLGPSPNLTKCGEMGCSNIKDFGYVDKTPKSDLSPEDTVIHNTVLQSMVKNRDTLSVNWPDRGPTAINEFTESRLFARAYPWLFPGGYGDILDYPGNEREWGRNLLQFEDGRFTRDKFFVFYALNYLTRKRNASSGNWFIKDFNHNGPTSLEELQHDICHGDTSFVNRLNYYNRNIKGSTPFWHSKRQELYTWINHHVEQGNGAPSFFITLSCSEYYWIDIIRLIKERMEMAGEDASDCFVGSPKLSKILNDYSIVVQEYFQKRVKIWLDTVGRSVFGISHYWVRFEFAPGRGQIHAHLLAVSDDKDLKSLCHLYLNNPDGEKERDKCLSEWAKNKFRLTAEVDESFDSCEIAPEESPCNIRFSDIPNDPRSRREDENNLMRFCQCHYCSGFCLRPDSHDRYVFGYSL